MQRCCNQNSSGTAAATAVGTVKTHNAQHRKLSAGSWQLALAAWQPCYCWSTPCGSDFLQCPTALRAWHQYRTRHRTPTTVYQPLAPPWLAQHPNPCTRAVPAAARQQCRSHPCRCTNRNDRCSLASNDPRLAQQTLLHACVCDPCQVPGTLCNNRRYTSYPVLLLKAAML